jgi:hypothetical protein
MLFAAATHFIEGLSHEILLKLKMKKSLIFLSGYMETNNVHNRTTVTFVLENVNKK